MKRVVIVSLVFFALAAVSAHADFVILRDGKSYAGTYTSAPDGKLTFKDTAGIQYTFPIGDVQSLVFSNLEDHISLRGGQSYSGHLLGATSVSFRGANGISYVFPLTDVSSLVFTGASSASASPGPSAGAPPAYRAPGNMPPAQPSYSTGPSSEASAATNYASVPPNQTPGASNYTSAPDNAAAAVPMTGSSKAAVVIPMGTQFTVRTDTAIDTAKDAIGKLYPARFEQSVMDSNGAITIPAGTAAQLQVVDLNQGTAATTRNLALDLYSVSLNGQDYRVDTSSVAENGSAGFGMNRRTALYAGGGAGLGALLGAVFGGGKGAGIGTLAGAGTGALAQYLTRGKRVSVPAETTLTFQLQQTMVLHP
jgi:outer membrane lipoprotein SlyB